MTRYPESIAAAILCFSCRVAAAGVEPTLDHTATRVCGLLNVYQISANLRSNLRALIKQFTDISSNIRYGHLHQQEGIHPELKARAPSRQRPRDHPTDLRVLWRRTGRFGALTLHFLLCNRSQMKFFQASRRHFSFSWRTIEAASFARSGCPLRSRITCTGCTQTIPA